jgi:beta-galactosidase/beta-glucuronidase
MKRGRSALTRLVIPGYLLLCSTALLPFASAQKTHESALTILPAQYGPFSAHILTGGRGLDKPLPAADPLLTPASPWTLSAWIEQAPVSPQTVIITGAGDPAAADARYFALQAGKPALILGPQQTLLSHQPLSSSGWHFFAATFDGKVATLFIDGAEVAHEALAAGPVANNIQLAPVMPCDQKPCPHFGGRIANLRLQRSSQTAAEIAAAAKDQPDASLIAFEEGSKPWALQVVQFVGNTAPQNPSTLPQQKVPFQAPKAGPLPAAVTTLQPTATPADWTIEGGWQLSAADQVTATADQISQPSFHTTDWLAATVPGTVLTTMINRGQYPDPDYGLNNLDIPESLNQQDYWYRVEFPSPKADASQSRRMLILDGINYHAEVWLNGQHLGSISGAFKRGVFDVTSALRTGPNASNALAILVSPAPHPGIPNVQSIALGSGLNGGAMALDGPTFMATEGWDWFPPMRDRDTGIWQNVHLVAEGSVSLGDPQVITHLPLPDISTADVTVQIPLHNQSDTLTHGTVLVKFEGVTIQKQVTAAPGDSTIVLSPKEFRDLHLTHPRLWWPNGYGAPNLYHMQVQFLQDGTVSSEQHLQFGVREVTYEISLLDSQGDLRRVDYDPTLAREAPASPVDVTHAGMRQVPDGWASSITKGQDASPAFTTIADTRATPYLILKVNGVRIATRGGSWGMDDTRKRISREHLEPFFRYDRDAHVNIIRNWQGQNTEPVFYELADEYGMMVWNDFWEVTQDSNGEAEDPELFLINAKDTIERYRNHPSIVMWCGRNEGVPQPIINKGLLALTHTLDGTRYYSPSSNQVNLQTSGPYSYEDPEKYYTTLDQGFAVEVGTPSLPTLEWFKRWLPEADRWPISDDWAYHNWHPHDALNQHMDAMFGASDNLPDYVRKAQMMNYVDYRAIFEGFNQHLWAPNGGRLLWMTQPAWPSTLWGILSSDYDTQASYYATRKACEPVHIQLDLSSDAVSVINTTRDALKSLTIQADVYSLDNQHLAQKSATIDAKSDDVTTALQLPLAPLMVQAHGGVVLVNLQLHAADGRLVSSNFYWRAAQDADYRAMNAMPTVPVSATAVVTAAKDPTATSTRTMTIQLKNTGSTAALATKLVTEYADTSARMNDDSDDEVLPAYYSDNYISLLPGESDTVTVDLPADPKHRALRVRVRGWNVDATSAPVRSN